MQILGLAHPENKGENLLLFTMSRKIFVNIHIFIHAKSIKIHLRVRFLGVQNIYIDFIGIRLIQLNNFVQNAQKRFA